MRVSINGTSEPFNDLLSVYEGTDLVCKIYDDNLQNYVLNERQLKQLSKGKFEFNIPIYKLRDYCEKWFLIGR